MISSKNHVKYKYKTDIQKRERQIYVIPSKVGLRIDQLEKHLNEELNLLKSYEDKLRYETNPSIKAKCKQEIEKSKQFIASFQQEYSELQNQIFQISSGSNLPLKQTAIRIVEGEFYKSKLPLSSDEKIITTVKPNDISNPEALDTDIYEIHNESCNLELDNLNQEENLYMSNIDPYLIHSFDVLNKKASRTLEEGEEQSFEAILQPMLIRVNDLLWEAEKIPDIQVISRMGYIIGCLGTWRTVEALSTDPDVLSIEASRSIENYENYQLLSFTRADTIHQVPEKGDMALIAVIDSGIDVLHETFLDVTGKQTRILAIWDQTDNTGPSPTNIPGLQSYGTEHTSSQINEYIQKQQVPTRLGRDTVSGHGTHVASIAAGRSFTNFPGGIAPEAKIIVVKTRGEYVEGEPFSIGYSLSHLNALTYIKHIAKQLNLPVVVNLSQGMNAGAHDGTSNLETAFDEFTKGGREPGYVIVKSAGNESGNDIHSLIQIANQSYEELIWQSNKDHIGSDVIELWFKSCDEIEFRLKNPSGEESLWINRNRRFCTSYFSTGNEYRITYIRYHYDNGDSLLSINISQGTSISIEKGRWTLEIQSGEVKFGEIHAWIERTRNRPINFVNHVNNDITLSIPGTARTVICVGSVRLSKPFRLSSFSSLGPTRDGRKKPDIVAPGESIDAAEAGSISGIKNDSGTSMAAPHITGAIALLFSQREKQRLKNPKLKQFNVAQIQAALSQTTQNYGNWVSGMGFGVVDIERFLRILD